MVGFYKHDIPAWMDGTEALSDGAYRAYHVIIQLIMLNEGPIARNDRGIAGRCNQTIKTFARNLDELLAAGKLTMVGDRIANARAEEELHAVRVNRENAGKGGKTPRKSEKTRQNPQEIQENPQNVPASPLENKGPDEATLQDLGSLKEKRRVYTPLPPQGAEPDGFAEWWEAYPRRDGANPRAPAAKRYALALKAGATPESLLRAVRAYAAELQRKGKLGTEFVKQAQFWLSPSDRLWEHYGQAGEAAPQKATAAGWSDDRWRDEVRRWKTCGGHWPWRNITPCPDAPNTQVPVHILAEMNIHPAVARAA